MASHMEIEEVSDFLSCSCQSFCSFKADNMLVLSKSADFFSSFLCMQSEENLVGADGCLNVP